jgi:hypothetical protein
MTPSDWCETEQLGTAALEFGALAAARSAMAAGRGEGEGADEGSLKKQPEYRD